MTMGTPEKNQPVITYKEYVTWPESQRCEVLEGKIISMAPSPIFLIPIRRFIHIMNRYVNSSHS